MLIITQKEIENEEYKDLREAAKERGHEAICISAGDLVSEATLGPGHGFRFCFGSTEFLNIWDQIIVAASIGLSENSDKGYSHNFNNFRCSKYYPFYFDYLFNKDFSFVPAGTLVKQRWQLIKNHGKDSKFFMRPDSGEKLFTGAVFDALDLEEYRLCLEEEKKKYAPIEQEMVVVSSPKKIAWEGRFYCCEDRIISQSSYSLHENITKIPSVPVGATDLAQKIISKRKFSEKFFTLDICSSDFEEFFLLEFNGFFSAGLYESNKSKIIEELEKMES